VPDPAVVKAGCGKLARAPLERSAQLALDAAAVGCRDDRQQHTVLDVVL
jgi:hypothetical protein